ncbi:MAGE protein [Kalmanozyma brasiliensis GHG001]|uniref:MAGE domain-containing protein n=1 Tax=Kalmanozyma brasiliensis (strain GHG001) TaxID=1365824 RepID=V5EK84_KALBG|nr:MAGE protein [Kalmanozyma brasiliensis GHG001]EST05280.1 MAGE protein [Kalmanozyma brasiliensis GHG001]
MSTYGRRSSQRLHRDEPPVASSSRRPPTSSRRNAEPVASSSSQGSQADAVDDFESRIDSILLPHKLLNVSDLARKAAQELGEAEINKKAGDLVRYTLSNEYKRKEIRRDDIRKDVFGEDKKISRCFAPIFNAAQKMLQPLGLHLVEVRSKGADNAELLKQAQEAIRAASSSANGLRARTHPPEEDATGDGGQGPRIWMLRSSLPSGLTKGLARCDEKLTDAYAQTSLTTAPSSSTQRRRPSAKDAKAALDWSSADHQDGEMGLLYIVLALILVSGRTITEATLFMYLRRLHLHPDTSLPKALRGTGPTSAAASTGSQSTQTQSRARASQGTLEAFLTTMTKQNYLERQRSDVGIDVMDAAVNQAQTQGRRRGRTSGGGGRAHAADDETTVWEWRWGSRAESEVGEKRIAELITVLFTDPSSTPEGAQGAEEEEDDDTQAIDRDRLAKRRKMLLTNITSVAGSQLID